MLSSMPKRRRDVILAFVHKGGDALSVKEVGAVAGVSPNTGQSIMQEMEWLKLVQLDAPGPGTASSIRLLPEWEWIGTGPFRQLLLQAEAWQHNGA